MVTDLQKASLWKRFAAWLLDAILVSVLAVGVGVALAALLGYDSYNDALNAGYARYEEEYGVTFQITQADYSAMTQQERDTYDAAYEALIADEQILKDYNMVVNQTMLIVTLGLLAAVLVTEFFIPLLLKNGQTAGKKVFAIGLIRTDAVQVNNLQLFTRALLGKFTLETMIPVYLALMAFFGILGLTGTLLLFALAVGEVILLGLTRNRSLLHDLIAGTCVVDLSSQQIFKSTQELIEYTKRIHKEKSAQQDY